MPAEQSYELIQGPERAFLVGIGIKGSRPLLTTEDSLAELTLLAKTAGMDVVGTTSQNVNHFDPATMIGSGKVEEVREALVAADAHTVIFDDELTPRHQRELEERFGEDIKVLDRSALILDIFAQHARTHEGALQVELAQYEYRLPRLTRQWTHLSRQAGGNSGDVGLRGPGETQLEVDRREIRRRISRLKQELEKVREHRSRHRQQRNRSGIPLVALVGYTNAGKSTLLHTLSGADVYIADQLFATLDPTTRRVDLPNGTQILLTDTVGFIQKLPTTLIAAFRATLEEITEADLILEVVDLNEPNASGHIETVEDTLAEIDVPPIPRILVWNKTDKFKGETIPEVSDPQQYFDIVAISAAKNQGLDKLAAAISRAVSFTLYQIKLFIPYERGDLVSQLHEQAAVHQQIAKDTGIELTVRLPANLFEQFKQYRISG